MNHHTSEYIQSFIESEFSINHISFSIKTKRMLIPLIEQLIQSKSRMIETNITQKHLNTLPTPKSFPILHKEMQKYLENMEFFSEEFSFTLTQRKYRIRFVLPLSSKKISKIKIIQHFKKCLKQIICWLSVCEKYATDTACSQEMDIYIYFTNHLKILPMKYSPIGVKHVNTAFTTSCQPKTEIILFREEEWLKVLIHETFHNMGLDFSTIMGTEYANTIHGQICDLFLLKSEVNLFETYCEIWAETIHSIFYLLFGEGERQTDKIIKKMEKIWKYEKLFSLFQTVKVLHHFGLLYSEIIRSNNIHYTYVEETNVLAYYILKSIGIFYLEDFMKWCQENNQSNLLQFTNNKSTIQRFCHFFKERYNTSEYLEQIHRMEEWFSRNSKRNTFEMQTLKMCVFE
jgi:hypothetical protein